MEAIFILNVFFFFQHIIRIVSVQYISIDFSKAQKAKYKKGSDDLLPIKATCAKLLYFSDYDRLRDV
jgi:hypothetical protein